MENAVVKGSHQFYKGRYFLAFYDKTGEHFLHSFDNVREILKFQNKPITTININLVNVELCRALKGNHNIKFLTGETMKVYIIDLNSED